MNILCHATICLIKCYGGCWWRRKWLNIIIIFNTLRDEQCKQGLHIYIYMVYHLHRARSDEFNSIFHFMSSLPMDSFWCDRKISFMLYHLFYPVRFRSLSVCFLSDGSSHRSGFDPFYNLLLSLWLLSLY